MKGTVKWFNNSKGYGFIKPEDGTKDLFVHHTSVKSNGYRTLIENQTVEFDIVESDKGPSAINVKPLD